MIKTYQIPVVYSSWGIVEVEAISLEEACDIARSGPLPYRAEYIDGSFEIDHGSSIYLDQLNEEPDLALRVERNLKFIESLRE